MRNACCPGVCKDQVLTKLVHLYVVSQEVWGMLPEGMFRFLGNIRWYLRPF